MAVALPASRFASVITTSRENSDSGEEVTISRRCGRLGRWSESLCASPLRRSLSLSAMPRAETGNGVSAESKAETSLDEFSLPLYRLCDDRDIFFLGGDDELVTDAETGASEREREVFDRAFLRVSRKRGRSGGQSESLRALPPR